MTKRSISHLCLLLCPPSLRDCVHLLDAMAASDRDEEEDGSSGQNTQSTHRGLMAGRFDLDGRKMWDTRPSVVGATVGLRQDKYGMNF